MQPVLSGSRGCVVKEIDGVKFGKTFAKWGNKDENLLNWVMSVEIGKVGGKNWNLL